MNRQTAQLIATPIKAKKTIFIPLNTTHRLGDQRLLTSHQRSFRFRPKRTFVVLAPWDAPRHPFQMTSPPNGSDYLIGRFFVGLLALVATVILISIAWEVSSGVVHHRTGGVSVRASDPKDFWIDIAVQFALAVFFGWQAYRLRQFAHRT